MAPHQRHPHLTPSLLSLSPSFLHCPPYHKSSILNALLPVPPLVGIQSGVESLETELDLFLEKTSMAEGTTATSFHGAWTQGKYAMKEQLPDSESKDPSSTPALPHQQRILKQLVQLP